MLQTHGSTGETPIRSHGRSQLILTAARLPDAELVRRVVALAGAEREATVELVAHLAEPDARRLYLGEGCGSLFGYCTAVLRLAEHAAFNRIEAARASRAFPRILDLLADGSLNLSTVRLIAPHLRADNFSSVVDRARGKSKREVEVLVACLAPRPDVPSSIRKLPTPAHETTAADVSAVRLFVAGSEPQTTAAVVGAPGSGSEDRATSVTLSERDESRVAASGGLAEACSVAPGGVGTPVPVPCVRRSDRPVLEAIAPSRYRLQFTVGEATHEKLRRAQDLCAARSPAATPPRSSIAR